jgi:hypothetical protein
MTAAKKIAPQSTELSLPERAAVALKSSDTEKQLGDLVKTSASITAITTKAGREECHTALMTLTKARTTIQKVGKAARDDATKFSKAVIAEENRLIGLVNAEELRLQVLRDTWDAKIELEKEEERRKEAARVELIRSRIEGVRRILTRIPGLDAVGIKTKIDELKAIAIDETFAEFKDEAQQAKAEVMGELVLAHNAAVKSEREAAEKAEADRIERENVAKQKAENDKLAAQLKEAQDKLAEQQAEIERNQQIERERLDAERIELDRQRAELAEAQKPAPVAVTPDPVDEFIEHILGTDLAKPFEDAADDAVAYGFGAVLISDGSVEHVDPADVFVDSAELEDRETIRVWLERCHSSAPTCATAIGCEIVNTFRAAIRAELVALDPN